MPYVRTHSTIFFSLVELKSLTRNPSLSYMFRVISLVVLFTLCGAWQSSSTRYSAKLFLSMKSKYLGTSPVFVAGGTNGVGLEVVKKLSSLGTPVRALVRRSDQKTMLESIPLVKAFIGDAADEAAVQSTMEGCIAAITTLGGKAEQDGKRIDYIGNSNVVEQAGILGCERIILVTSIGCGTTKDAISPQVYSVLEEALVAKDKAERDLRMYTNLDWTIIRPGGLKSEPPTVRIISVILTNYKL